MTGFLASVKSEQEARMVLGCDVDIIDVKQPEAGALGAVPLRELTQIIDTVAGQTLVSATIGDLPAHSSSVPAAVAQVATAGVDVVKIGLFEPRELNQLLPIITAAAGQGTQIVLVLFADAMPDLDRLNDIADSGPVGVMLDTRQKKGGSLRHYLSHAALTEFMKRAQRLGLVTGLAGSLGKDDIRPLLAVQPDYLGFRGALCHRGQREDDIDLAAVSAIRKAIPRDAVGIKNFASASQ